jgi:squalene synthase HpnC
LSSDNAAVNPSRRIAPQGVDHYENFPVASWLCPPRLRPPIIAIYRFARAADDIADEGNAPAEVRLAELCRFRAELNAIATHVPAENLWPEIFDPLERAVREFALPVPLLDALLSAFEQDVAMSRDGAVHPGRSDLLDYCSRSANPVGRLLLHLYGIDDAAALAQSDSICTALQLINFWQDAGLDLARGRHYLTAQDLERHGMAPAFPQTWPGHPNAPALITECAAWSRALMLEGAPLVHRVPGRAGWELRLVVQGGLRILDRIAAMDHQTLRGRPRLRGPDLVVMLWRSLWM